MATLFNNTPNTGVQYAGKNLPAQAKTYTPVVDPNNKPYIFTFVNQTTGTQLTLPGDIMPVLNGKKMLAKNNILDAVNVGSTIQVVERINREPYNIELEFNLWLLAQGPDFPQAAIEELFTVVWIPDTVLSITNTYLNGLGVHEVIIEKISPKPQRGSTNLHVTLKCIENVPGQSLIVAAVDLSQNVPD